MKRWENFCNHHGSDIFNSNLQSILKFLTALYKDGVGYSGINTARSALSLIIAPIDGVDVGKHPLVIRLLKAVSKLRPPKPRYDNVWDVNLVLDMFTSWPLNSELPIFRLTIKLVALLALVTGQRVQTLSLININNIIRSSNVQILIPEIIKTSGVAKKQPCLLLVPYKVNDKLCVVKCLDEYLNRTASYRNSDELLISVVLPYKPVTSQTISRWLKECLSLAGIDVSIFKAHSFRHASTSKAVAKGVSLDVVFSRAGWSDKSKTFAKFYNKPLDLRGEFSNAVLS